MASYSGGGSSLAAQLPRYNDDELTAAVALVQLAQPTPGVRVTENSEERNGPTDEGPSSDDDEPSNQAKAQQPLLTRSRPDTVPLSLGIKDAHTESLIARYMLHEIEAQNFTEEKSKNISIKLETYHGIKLSSWYIESYWNRYCREGTGVEERTGERAGGRGLVTRRNDFGTKRAYRRKKKEEVRSSMRQEERDAAKSRLYDAFRAAGLLS
ncbi:MAG: hypothetical protein Q9225_003488 [Loekoesia sp. 1 TL-2023]